MRCRRSTRKAWLNTSAVSAAKNECVKKGAESALFLPGDPMEIAALPFNKLIGLEIAGPDNDEMMALPARERYLNHVGTLHASALLAVAEAGSGELLQRHCGHRNDLLPVLRKLEAKFRKPANGRV